MTRCIIEVITAADGSATPHDGRYIVAWNPHTKAGILALDSTPDRAKATIFDFVEALDTWLAISNISPIRPDGKPNRPLSGVSVTFETV